MSLANAYGNYRHIQIKTADGGALILMLYDGAIVALKSAQKLIDTKPLNREQIADQIIIAKNIVYELAASLNLEDGGEIAESLLNLYSYFIWRIGKANLEKESAYLDDVLNHLQDLREAWGTVFQQERVQPETPFPSYIPQPSPAAYGVGASIVA